MDRDRHRPVRQKDRPTDQQTQLSGKLTLKLKLNSSFIREPLSIHVGTVGCLQLLCFLRRLWRRHETEEYQAKQVTLKAHFQG